MEREPRTAQGQRLRASVSEQRWHRIVVEAEQRAAVYEVVAAHQASSGGSWRESVAQAAPEVPWPTFVRYKRRFDGREGETWERMLDERVPPDQRIDEEVRAAARTLRRMDRSMNAEKAQRHLTAQFGEEGTVSATWLKRVWAEAGLHYVRGGGSGAGANDEDEDEQVEVFHGGAGLALPVAADTELGMMHKLAAQVLSTGAQRAEDQQAVGALEQWVEDGEGRDERGRFTEEYNARHRASVLPGEADGRWTTDRAKAAARPLSTLSVLSNKAETLAAKLLAMGVSPLLTERRGFDGLDGPAGEWLGVLGGAAYMPATLDKALAELGLLDVADAMWDEHARTWNLVSRQWSEPGPGWLQSAVYIDGTADPYWTRAFAKSGKVSRVGRVMPCLTRVAMHSGAGVPLLVETHVGAVSLRERLLPMLARLDEALGPDADVERLTIVDSEIGTASMLWALHEQTAVTFITVLKGQVLAGAHIHSEGEWQPYRERDQLRAVEVTLRGKGAPEGGMTMRGVQMQRAGGRHRQMTLFVTNGNERTLSTEQVATRYLRRWPLEEQAFRLARDGGGMERSHGYGGSYVAHVALDSRRERAERSVAHAGRQHARALDVREQLGDGLVQVPAAIRKRALALADKAVRETEKRSLRSEETKAQLETMPDQIYVRDTGRDSVMTCLKLGVLALAEFVLQEYFGGAQMQWRTFIEQFVALPVTVRTRGHCRIFQIHANRRQPEQMARLAAALAEMNRRKISRHHQLLVFELLDLKAGGS